MGKEGRSLQVTNNRAENSSIKSGPKFPIRHKTHDRMIRDLDYEQKASLSVVENHCPKQLRYKPTRISYLQKSLILILQYIILLFW